MIKECVYLGFVWFLQKIVKNYCLKKKITKTIFSIAFVFHIKNKKKK